MTQEIEEKTETISSNISVTDCFLGSMTQEIEEKTETCHSRWCMLQVMLWFDDSRN